MKTTTKLMAIGIAALTLIFANNVKAQTAKAGEWSASIGINPGIPTGNATDISKIVIGGTARLEYNAKSNVAFMVTAGYYDFIGKTSALDPSLKFPSLGMVPVKVGAKYYVAPMFY